MPAVLSLTFRAKNKSEVAGKTSPTSFFEIPYIKWFFTHFSTAALGIIAVLFLGVFNVIDEGTISGLLGGLFGYVLGSASSAHGTMINQTKGTQPPSNGTPVAFD